MASGKRHVFTFDPAFRRAIPLIVVIYISREFVLSYLPGKEEVPFFSSGVRCGCWGDI